VQSEGKGCRMWAKKEYVKEIGKERNIIRDLGFKKCNEAFFLVDYFAVGHKKCNIWAAKKL
jgi:hypothetical protein